MIVKLLTEHHLEFLSIKGGCTMPHCWNSHITALFYFQRTTHAFHTSLNARKTTSVYQTTRSVTINLNVPIIRTRKTAVRVNF